MIKKQLYEAPEAQTLVVRFEGVILTVSDLGADSGFSENGVVTDRSGETWW